MWLIIRNKRMEIEVLLNIDKIKHIGISNSFMSLVANYDGNSGNEHMTIYTPPDELSAEKKKELCRIALNMIEGSIRDGFKVFDLTGDIRFRQHEKAIALGGNG